MHGEDDYEHSAHEALYQFLLDADEEQAFMEMLGDGDLTTQTAGDVAVGQAKAKEIAEGVLQAFVTMDSHLAEGASHSRKPGATNVTASEAEVIARCVEWDGPECAMFVTGRSWDTVTRCLLNSPSIVQANLIHFKIEFHAIPHNRLTGTPAALTRASTSAERSWIAKVFWRRWTSKCGRNTAPSPSCKTEK